MSARRGSVPVIKSNNPSVGVVRWMGSSEARMNSSAAVMIWDMVSLRVCSRCCGCCLALTCWRGEELSNWLVAHEVVRASHTRNDTAEIKLNSCEKMTTG
eukprot:scaffold21553_cov22-Cyclotella_meneghiniana.AAC.2